VIYLIVFIAGAALGGWAGWRFGWNAAVLLYRDRTIDQANARYEQDRK